MLYRKEIDGLRAISVLAVMLFHAKIPLFYGGFIGVDVFFVISGYLITQIILTQMQAGRFSLIQFYDRRARRILPALFAMIFICLPLAWLIMINPADFKDFCKSVFAIPLFVSNVLFWRESGYFDISANLKPFLHTWSLAVEEQYYLFFPLYLLAVWKAHAKLVWLLTISLAILSLIFAQWGSTHQPVFNFYWLPSRAWELLAGAMIPISRAAFKNTDTSFPSFKGVSECMGLIGLVLIMSSIFLMNEQMLWPSVWTTIPVAGTVLILLFSSSLTFAGRLLSITPLVGIGLISYSAYLWHQPLFAFARYQFDDLTLLSRTVLLIVALVLGWLSWKFIETPFRDKNRFTTKQIFIGALACMVFFVSVGLTGYLRDGFLYRISSKDEPVFTYSMKTFMQDIRGDRCFIQLQSSSYKYASECSASSPLETPAMLWGDSHAAALYTGFKKRLGAVHQYTAGSCPPLFWSVKERPGCIALNQNVMEEIQRIKPGVIYLEANWFGYAGDPLSAAKAIKQIREWIPGVRFVMIGNVPNWPRGLPREVLQSMHTFDQELYAPMPMSMLSVLKDSDKRLAEFAREQGIDFVSALDLVCKQQGCLAIAVTDHGPRLTAFDRSHLTRAGSESLVNAILDK